MFSLNGLNKTFKILGQLFTASLLDPPKKIFYYRTQSSIEILLPTLQKSLHKQTWFNIDSTFPYNIVLKFKTQHNNLE